MNRRGFVKLLGALPIVGGLAKAQEAPAPRIGRLGSVEIPNDRVKAEPVVTDAVLVNTADVDLANCVDQCVSIHTERRHPLRLDMDDEVIITHLTIEAIFAGKAWVGSPLDDAVFHVYDSRIPDHEGWDCNLVGLDINSDTTTLHFLTVPLHA